MEEVQNTDSCEHVLNSRAEFSEMNEFLKFEDPIDFSLLETAFEESPIYTAQIENGPETITTYVAKIDEHDESAG